MKKYDQTFKREALRKIHDGQSVASHARELGVSERLGVAAKYLDRHLAHRWVELLDLTLDQILSR